MRSSFVLVSALCVCACGPPPAPNPGPDPAIVIGDGGVIEPRALDNFSFFVTSAAALKELSGSDDGFGGDLRFGESGPAAGLRGADKLCATIAERSMMGAGQKGWRAFLSASADAKGRQVNAIDRVGAGPWYDRLGRLLGNTGAELLAERPAGAHVAVRNDLPDENGAGATVTTRDVLTGASASGALHSGSATCGDWTSTTVSGRPRIGHAKSGDEPSWFSAHDAAGCRAGTGVNSVGSEGGYGGFYCFAMIP